MSAAEPTPEPVPVFSVVRGNPTDEELAALVVVLTRRSPSRPEPNPRTATTGWSAYGRGVRVPLHPGPGVWRMSGRG